MMLGRAVGVTRVVGSSAFESGLAPRVHAETSAVAAMAAPTKGNFIGSDQVSPGGQRPGSRCLP